MYVYWLRPVPEYSGDPAWQTSTHREACTVNAETEAEAREAANAAFIVGVERIAPGQSVPYPPWKQDRLVTCERAADAPPSDKARGVVFSPDGRVLFDPNKD